ncbi:hypothetical protein FA13DRAFT_1728089 [Coprinellus micaceus]|uniref:Extracellular membrane protein CFEM domain-containing protein n=1 Tax=Coprinellus micaceus TaxID=71717 RepID=A0A4Y7TMV5_COPMI|nr:hypothetical protein FA13DRAFT_1728089 [Coprinellus micaceus]
MFVFSALSLFLLPAMSPVARGASTHGRRDIHAIHPVVSRQQNTNRLPIVAAQCSDFCDPVNALVLTGCPGQACCTDGFVDNFNSCAICIQEDAGSSNYGGAQAFFNHWSGSCSDRGRPVKPVTIGQKAPPANTSPTSPPPQPTTSTTASPPPPSTTTSTSQVQTTSTRTTSTTSTTGTTQTGTATSDTASGAETGAAGPPGTGAKGVVDPGDSDVGGSNGGSTDALNAGNGAGRMGMGRYEVVALLCAFLISAML